MEDYEDIINLPHHVSRRHVQMPLLQRAAQFAPFAALAGYEEAINEAAAAHDVAACAPAVQTTTRTQQA